jgi:hypothetical protein
MQAKVPGKNPENNGMSGHGQSRTALTAAKRQKAISKRLQK